MRILKPRGTGDTVTADYNEIHDFEPDNVKKAKLEQWIAKAVGTVLVREFPNRQWKVIVDIEGRMLIVGCDSISNTKGYHIKMVGRTLHDLQERAKLAAGEILERHNLARTKRFDADLIETLARDATDSVIAADAAPDTKRFTA